VGNGALTRAIFLDRDGVINEAVVRDGLPYPPDVHELRIVDGALGALESLANAGLALYVVTNQPDIARGTVRPQDVAAIHARLLRELPIDGIYVCPHDDADACACRKPLPGMLIDAQREHDIDLTASFLIGDRAKDIAAGRAAGVTTVFIDHGYRESGPEPAADGTVLTLPGAVEWILNRLTDER
jgi:D-glycero-D-manno-heptose 1,7-bisphosphate phosphatase